MKKQKTTKPLKEMRAWAHLALTMNKPFEIILSKKKPKCAHSMGHECMVRCVIKY